MSSIIGNRKETWPLGIGALFVLGIFACEFSGDMYSDPLPENTGGNAGTASGGDGGSAGAAGSAGGGSGGSAGSENSATEETVLDLNDGIVGWSVAYTSPTSLTAPVAENTEGDAGVVEQGLADAGVDAGTTPTATVDALPGVEFAFVTHDSDNGDPEAGSMLINVPFNTAVQPPAADPFYKVGVEVRFDSPRDFSEGRNLQIRARLNDGVFTSDATPPQIKIYIRTGPAGETGIYANYGFNLEAAARGTWQTYSFPLASPQYAEEGVVNLQSVTTLGIEIASGQGTVVEPGTIHVDSFVLTD